MLNCHPLWERTGKNKFYIDSRFCNVLMKPKFIDREPVLNSDERKQVLDFLDIYSGKWIVVEEVQAEVMCEISYKIASCYLCVYFDCFDK